MQLQPKALQSKSEVQAKNYVKIIYQIKISEKEKNLPLNILEKKWKVLLFSDIVSDCDMLHVIVLYFLYLFKN